LILAIAAIAAAAAAGAPPPSTAEIASKVECASRQGVEAALCLAMLHASANRYADAAEQFEKAAELSRVIASTLGDPRTDRALAAAGNMWIAAGQPGKAAFALDKALAGKGLEAQQRGEALLDRARAAEAQGDLKTARARTSEAAATIAEDPFYWYFSAALAIREGDGGTARTAIGRALALAPSDPLVLFEAGHVADFNGDQAAARSYWMRAAGSDPGGEVGKAAAKAVEMLGVTPAVKNEAIPAK